MKDLKILFLTLLLFILCFNVNVHAICPGGTCTEPVTSGRSSPENPSRNTSTQVSIVPFYSRTGVYKHSVLPPAVLYPEKVEWVRISATDVNRIVCSAGDISDVFYSAEKGVRVKVAGSEAYIKLQAKIENGRLEYSKIPTEFYIVCAGKTYGFIGRPKRIPSRTIYLRDPAHGSSRNLKIYSGEIDRVIVKILKAVYLNQIPESWQKLKSSIVKKSPIIGVDIKESQRFRIPGTGIVVRVLLLHPYGNISVYEKDLLNPTLTANPIAISIEKSNLLAQETVKAIIIEKIPEVRQ